MRVRLMERPKGPTTEVANLVMGGWWQRCQGHINYQCSFIAFPPSLGPFFILRAPGIMDSRSDHHAPILQPSHEMGSPPPPPSGIFFGHKKHDKVDSKEAKKQEELHQLPGASNAHKRDPNLEFSVYNSSSWSWRED